MKLHELLHTLAVHAEDPGIAEAEVLIQHGYDPYTLPIEVVEIAELSVGDHHPRDWYRYDTSGMKFKKYVVLG